MSHRYKVREIAQQSGLSEATVDRVLNERGGVRETTRDEVQQAISDLDRQRTQLRLVGRKFFVDVVLQTPARFSAAVQAALEDELPGLQPAVVRGRFHFRETGSTEAMVGTLDAIGRRGSHGVVVKAPDTREVEAAIDRLVAAKIPVVTFVTDVPGSTRLGYVGIDNRAAGGTAAYLIEQWLAGRAGNVLISAASSSFRNEEEREIGFRSTIRTLSPARTLIDLPNGDGLDESTYRYVLTVLDADPSIRAVYSIGGANTAILAAFAARGRECTVFIAHDLDRDNVTLLRDGKLSAVMHHDLRSDVRLACRIILHAHGAIGPASRAPSVIQVITPFNLPASEPRIS